MMRSGRLVLCWFLLLLLPLLCYGQANEGKVTGTVLDEQGRPVEGAQVCIFDFESHMNDCRTSTDQTGQFQIQHVPFGKRGVSATKDQDGYGGLTNGPPYESVNLTDENPLVQVTLKFGAKDGTLVPTASNKITGNPIYALWVSWDIPEEHGSHSYTTGTSRWSKRITVPVGKDICPTLSAKGYRSSLRGIHLTRPSRCACVSPLAK
jgi:hypothetical protein